MLQGEIKNRRATQCVQQEYSWLLAALAELRLAHSRQRHAPLLSITRHRQATATVMATIIGHEMDVPRGGRFRAETAHPTKVRGVEAGTPGMGAHPVTRYRVETAHRTEVTEIRPYCGRRGHFFCDANGPGRREAARRGHSLLLVLRRC
jgi:hypothetical protein